MVQDDDVGAPKLRRRRGKGVKSHTRNTSLKLKAYKN